MNKKYHCLYQIVNKINGMIYIGMHSTDNLFDSYMGSGKNIVAAHKEFGRENFIKYIIGLYDTKYEMIQAEMQIVNKEFALREDTYNICKGGNGINPNWVSLETRQKLSNSLIGRIVSEETRQKLSEANKGVPFTEERKLNISNGSKGKILTCEHKENISKGHINREYKQHSEETKQKISNTLTGKIHSEETKQKMSESQKGKNLGKIHSEESRKNMSDAHKGKKQSIETINKRIETRRINKLINSTHE